MPKMSRTKYLKGACQHCGGHLEFEADHIGMTVPCPHCQQETELSLLPAPEEPAIPRRTLVWTAIAVLVLGVGFGAALVALRRAQRWAESHRHPPAAEATPVPPLEAATSTTVTNTSADTELSASEVVLQKTPGSSLVYAVGTVRNPSPRQRFGVKVELDLFDANGVKIGSATDYRQLLEPGTQWDFKALVVSPKATSAKVAAVKEDQ